MGYGEVEVEGEDALPKKPFFFVSPLMSFSSEGKISAFSPSPWALNFRTGWGLKSYPIQVNVRATVGQCNCFG